VSADSPLFLLGLLAFVPIFLADAFSARRRRILALLPPGMKARFRASTALFRLSMAFLLVALAGPRWGAALAEADVRRAVDAVFAVDVSRSMEVPDGLGEYASGAAPTRLDRGLEIAREAVVSLPGARYAVAVSRGRGILAVPLTWDQGSVLAFIDALGGSAMTGWGTNLEALAEAAASAFQPFSPARRVVVLISDGEELSGDLRAASARLAQEGASIVAVAVGSESGGTFPDGDGVVSRRDSELMRAAAAATGGLYVDASHPEAARALVAHLAAGAPAIAAGEGAAGSGLRPRWFAFAALSLVAFGASKACLLGSRARREGGGE